MTDQTKIKLSEAIRNGIKRRGETNEAYFSTPTRHSDAIGAALEGAGLVSPGTMTCAWLDNFGYQEAHEILVRYWGRDPIESTFPCPANFCLHSAELHEVIDHLTDAHGCSRAAIAEWLEGRGF